MYADGDFGGACVQQAAFDGLVEGVDAVIHTATPVTTDFKTVDDAFTAAIEGTLTVLRSVLKHRYVPLPLPLPLPPPCPSPCLYPILSPIPPR